MPLAVHAIRTGSVRIKTAQIRGQGHGLARQLNIVRDRAWSDWLPTYAWLIDHPEGPILVDTGEARHLMDHAASWHPYLRWEVHFDIDADEEVGPKLKALGLSPRDLAKVVLTHLHVDHDGGLAHLQNVPVFLDAGELEAAKGVLGRIRGYLPNRWPRWFDPKPLSFEQDSHAQFPQRCNLTSDGAVFAVPTPGHTPHHVSVFACADPGADRYVCMAGDTSYTQQLMVEGVVDGISGDEEQSKGTLAQLREFAASHSMIYLPTHDPDSERRLISGETVKL